MDLKPTRASRRSWTSVCWKPWSWPGPTAIRGRRKRSRRNAWRWSSCIAPDSSRATPQPSILRATAYIAGSRTPWEISVTRWPRKHRVAITVRHISPDGCSTATERREDFLLMQKREKDLQAITTAIAGSRIVIERRKPMNEDKVKGQWKQLRGKVKARWGKLTDDDLDVAEGNSDYLAGRLQERYGIARDEAKKQLREFERDI